MKILLSFLMMGVVVTGCVEEEEILAYKYDPDRLCLIDPKSPVIVDVRDPLPKSDITAFVSKCSANEDKGLVAFQHYFLKGFVECTWEVWGDVYWGPSPSKQELVDLKCAD